MKGIDLMSVFQALSYLGVICTLGVMVGGAVWTIRGIKAVADSAVAATHDLQDTLREIMSLVKGLNRRVCRLEMRAEMRDELVTETVPEDEK